MSELKPCPFCGSTDVAANSYSIEASVRCFGCFAVIVRKHPKYSDGGLVAAITAWNTRADLSDALLREAMDALQWLREVTEPPDRNCSCHRSAPCGWCEQHAAVAEAHEEARATLAKLWAHLDGRADEGGVSNGI